MNKYVVIVESKEARSGYNNAVVTKEGTKLLVVNEPEGWVEATSHTWDGKGFEGAKLFKSKEVAINFAKRWKGHPWYCKPNGVFQIFEVTPAYEQKLVGYQATGPACSLKYDRDTGRMIEVTMEEL